MWCRLVGSMICVFINCTIQFSEVGTGLSLNLEVKINCTTIAVEDL
jgi:hypothetical protein